MTTVEHDIVAQVYAAKEDSDAADQFIQQYLPFIRSETAKFVGAAPDHRYEDELSIAMLAFLRGHPRLCPHTGRSSPMRPGPSKTGSSIIPGRRNATRTWFPSTPLRGGGTDVRGHPSRPKRPDGEYDLRQASQQEIQEFGAQLAQFGLTFSQVADNSPKQARTLTACHRVLTTPGRPPAVGPLSGDPAPPIKELSQGAGGGQKDPRTTPSLFGGHPPGLHQRL